jgi:hypothetical protein
MVLMATATARRASQLVYGVAITTAVMEMSSRKHGGMMNANCLASRVADGQLCAREVLRIWELASQASISDHAPACDVVATHRFHSPVLGGFEVRPSNTWKTVGR